MERLLRYFLRQFIRQGDIRVTTPRGSILAFGDGTGQPLRIRFTSWGAVLAVLLDPELKAGDAYMDGTLVVEQGSIADVLAVVLAQHPFGPIPVWTRPQRLWRYLRRRLQQFNPQRRAQRNVAHHYDLDGRLYALFLDADQQYSCALFREPGSVPRRRAARQETAHRRQADIAAAHAGARHRLRLGRACLYLVRVRRRAGHRDHVVAGAIAPRARTRRREGAVGRVGFRLQDYREVTGTFDRIVSVGMFEHVGISYYNTFFRKCAELLDDDGVMLLHSIGRSDPPGITNPWIAKYIFPGGYIPALSEVLPAIERAGLLITDIEVLRLHYAETLKAWRDRFLAHRDEVTRLYDPRFVRMWEFYLACSEMAFREQAMMVMQIQLTKRQGIVPMTRDYIAREEARLRANEGGKRQPLRLAGE